MTSLTFIWHDCFLLRTERLAVVFDYWKDGHRRASVDDAPAFLDTIPPDVPLYVLVSHHHKDHFHKSIFAWERRHPLIRFIISRDTERSVRYMLRPDSVYAGFKPSPEKVNVLRPDEEWSDALVKVSAFGSTDTGNSYLLTLADGKRVFHAGDLNAWTWRDESTQAEVDEAVGAYRSILATIAEAAPHIDMAMFPVDSRIGTGYAEGAAMFVRAIEVDRFFPMHFCLADSEEQLTARMADACRLDLYANPERGEYIALQQPYSVFAKA